MSVIERSCDVLIIGSGMQASLTAALCARKGVQVCLARDPDCALPAYWTGHRSLPLLSLFQELKIPPPPSTRAQLLYQTRASTGSFRVDFSTNWTQFAFGFFRETGRVPSWIDACEAMQLALFRGESPQESALPNSDDPALEIAAFAMGLPADKGVYAMASMVSGISRHDKDSGLRAILDNHLQLQSVPIVDLRHSSLETAWGKVREFVSLKDRIHTKLALALCGPEELERLFSDRAPKRLRESMEAQASGNTLASIVLDTTASSIPQQLGTLSFAGDDSGAGPMCIDQGEAGGAGTLELLLSGESVPDEDELCARLAPWIPNLAAAALGDPQQSVRKQAPWGQQFHKLHRNFHWLHVDESSPDLIRALQQARIATAKVPLPKAP